MADWIKCSERMPTQDEAVLCWLPSKMQAYEVLWMTDFEDAPWSGRDVFYELEIVTHWMALPAAPPDQTGAVPK